MSGRLGLIVVALCALGGVSALSDPTHLLGAVVVACIVTAARCGRFAVPSVVAFRSETIHGSVATPVAPRAAHLVVNRR